MKIEQVKIKKFKSLNDFEGNFNQHHVLLIGENAIGKSSIIQFIELALGKQTNIPIGADGEGVVIANINGEKYTFAVKLRDGKPVVTITAPNGLKDTSKGALANIVGAIDFDIDKFADLSKTKAGRKEQVEEFKSFLPQETIEFFNQTEAKIKVTYDERTSLNRMIKENEAYINSNPLFNRIGFDKFEKVNTDTLFTEMQVAQKTNEKLIGFAAKVTELENQNSKYDLELKETLAQIEALKLKAVSIKEMIVLNEDKINTGKDYLNKNKPIDLSGFEEKLKSANKQNKEFEDSEILKGQIKQLEKMKLEAGDMTALIDSSKQAILDTIRQIDSPVQGLEFDEEQLVYKGIPVSGDNLSTSELMELGMLMRIAKNPNAPIFLQRTESIGQERWNNILAIANKLNLQIIGELVKRGQNELTIELIP